MAIQTNIVIEIKQLKDLKPNPDNPRQSTRKQEKSLDESLKKYGILEPVIWNKQTGYIVGGHFRVRQLLKLGVVEMPCIIVDLSPEDEKEAIIRLNANTGEWDWDKLANIWNADDLVQWGLDVPVFDAIEPEKETEEKKPLICPHCGKEIPN